jgi:hypothetical protein
VTGEDELVEEGMRLLSFLEPDAPRFEIEFGTNEK